MSTESDAVSDALAAAISGPAEVSGDMGTIKQQPIGDLIEADRYFRARDAASKGRRGLRFTRLIPPGTV